MAYKPNDEQMELIRTTVELGHNLHNSLAAELLRAHDWQAELGQEQAQATTTLMKERDAEIKRLRGLLAALVTPTPLVEVNGWMECHWCACNEGEQHAPGCAWAAAKAAVAEAR